MSDSSPTNPAHSVPAIGDLRGRVALVTGVGRRKGIGSAVCLALASRGADVVLSYWRAYDREMPWASDEDEPEVLLDELRATGVRAEGIEIDLSRSDSARLLLDAAEEKLGKPSILVNTAAYSTRDGFETLDAEALDAHYAVNVRAMALLSVGFARRYPGGPGGSWGTRCIRRSSKTRRAFATPTPWCASRRIFAGRICSACWK